MKGILDDPHCRWIAEQLDEKETTAPLHGGDVGWRDKLEKDNEVARKEGAAGVAARKPGCRRLYLNDNPITGEGIEYLADALRRNKTLEVGHQGGWGGGGRGSGEESRFGGVKTRLGGVKTRYGSVKTRLGGVKTRFGGVKTRCGGVKTRFGGVKTMPALFD